MSEPRVLVVEHEENAGSAFVGRTLREAGALLSTVGPDTGSPVPESLDGFDGLVVMGGVPGAEDDERAPWLPVVRARMAEAVQQDVPVLAICLGAQLLAVATGGAVADAATPEVGVQAFSLTAAAAEDPLLRHAAEVPQVLQWHSMEVSRLPQGAVVLGSNAACAHQVFRIGSAWGFQGHIEADPTTARGWWHPDSEGSLPEALGLDGEAVVSHFEDSVESLHAQWAPVIGAWLEQVRVARGRTADSDHAPA